MSVSPGGVVVKHTVLCALAIAFLLGLFSLGCQGEKENPAQGKSAQGNAAQAGPAPGTLTTVYLGRSPDWNVRDFNGVNVRLLERELFRQAFLVAARDELGLTTRDSWLGDSIPTDGENAPWDLKATPGDPSVAELVHGFPANRTSSAQFEIAFNACKDYETTAAQAEVLSRGKFVEALKQAGASVQPNKRNESVAVPEKVEKLLGEMNFLSQFQAARELHEAIRNQGESSALVGALVRAYANLGVMTEFHWHPAHKVFKARALLYARRMAARDPRSPAALWHCAYAAALSGVHCGALRDLDEAEKIWESLDAKDRPAKPIWLEPVELMCRFDIEELGRRASDRKTGKLASLLHLLAVEQAGCKNWAVQTAIGSVQAIPECYRVHDTISEFAGVSVLHTATLLPVTIFGKTLYPRLASMPGLPDEVLAIVKTQTSSTEVPDDLMEGDRSLEPGEFKVRRQTMDALLKADRKSASHEKDKGKTQAAPAGEPSWAALGLLIRELSFVQACRRAYFERHCWGVPTEEWLATAAPLFEGHRYQPYLESFASESRKAEEAMKRLTQADLAGIEFNVGHMLWAPPEGPERQIFSQPAQRNSDFVARDLVMQIRVCATSRSPEPSRTIAKILLALSPYSPFARAILVERDWDNVQRDVKEWDKHAEQYPWLAFSLGVQYARLKRWDDAERCFKATVKIVPPEVEAWKQLAAVYFQQDKTDRWLATLDEYLKQPDYGLAHYSVQSEVAYHFIKKKEWEKALPYAKGAAECYSCWGLRCAGECCEGLKQWDEAEKYSRACSERYESSGLEWYLFCCRTGHGDLDSARKLARSSVEKAAKMADKPDHFNFTTYYLLERQPEKALAEIEQALGKTPGSIDLLWAAVVADQAKDAKKRDAFLDRVRKPAEKPDAGKAKDAVKKVEGPGDGAKPLADLLVDDLAKGGKGKIDLAAANKLFAPLDPWYASWCRFLLGQYLDVRGQTESANTLWKQAVSCPQMGGHRTIACSMLLERGIKFEDEKPAAKPAEKPEGDKAGTSKPKASS